MTLHLATDTPNHAMPNSRNLALLLAAISAAVALSACGGGGDEPTPAPELNKALCFDNSIYAAGASYKLNFTEGQSKPSVTGTVLATDASFGGTAGLVEFRETTNNTVTSVVTRYMKPVAEGVISLHGTVAAQGTLTYTTTTYTPPYEDRRAELAAGETRTFTGQGTRAEMFSPQPIPYTRQEQVKFVGVERLVMPAGTFTACRYEVDGNTTEWWHRSLVIRRDRTGAEPRILHAGEINGVPLKSQ